MRFEVGKTYGLWLVVALLILGCRDTNSVKFIRLAHGLDINHSVHKAMVKLGEDLSQLSNGTIQLEIYPNQQLGTEREILETDSTREP